MPLNAPVRELTFCDGQRLTLDEDSIVMFVGPNNAGKTTCLRDIYGCLASADSCRIVKQVCCQKPSLEEIQGLLERVSKEEKQPISTYYGMGFRIGEYDLEKYTKQDSYPAKIRDMLFSMLTTEDRLGACSPAGNTTRDEPAESPVTLLARDRLVASRTLV